MAGAWVRVDLRTPCPVCGKADWCMLHIDGRKVICPRVKSGSYIKGSGYFHKLYNNGLLGTKKAAKRRSNRMVNWFTLAQLYMRQADATIWKLSKQLGLSVDTLSKFCVGWDGEAYTIPCYTGFQEMNGIMRRWPDGSKKWVTRSRNGLFIPKMKSIEGNVFIPEGFSDAAALVELGFRAIGRPNCEVGLEGIKDFIADNPNIAMITVVGDNDPDNVHGDVGQRGAERLVRELYGNKVQLGILDIPKQFKDTRQWCAQGMVDHQSIIMKVRRV